MNIIKIEDSMRQAITTELQKSKLFAGLSTEDLGEITKRATMIQYNAGDIVVNQGDKSDSFFVIIEGEVVIKAMHETKNELVEIARVKPFDTIGEIGMLLDQPRSATVEAGADAVLLMFDSKFFNEMFMKLPSLGLVTCKVLAQRLQQSSRKFLNQAVSPADMVVNPEVMKLLPVEFMQRQRVLPMKAEGNILTIGFVDDPSPQVINLTREALPGMELRPVPIDSAAFNTAMMSAGIGKEITIKSGTKPTKGGAKKRQSPHLDELLRRMVAERASDLHISAAHKPRWRIDGEILEIGDAQVLSSDDIYGLIEPIMPERNITQYASDNDTDFAYAIEGVARFRVNIFCDNKGVGGVFRQIPSKILSVEQLGLPAVVRRVCDYPKGLILVTGPTGSGKSTTLAAMIDYINKTRTSHIITMEDPIEFVHISQKCLINQREVGPHTTSFSRALRAVLREDPDIVLVGEMRDLETVQLALETANTGHLVFGTLHTNTAVTTITRIIDMFPANQQNQIKTGLADGLKAVIAQTLCKRKGGGRVAGLEIMVSDTGVSNLIREGKTQQLMSAMQTGKARGNRILNEELARLVKEGIVEPDEALSKTVDKPDLASKLGIKLAAEE